MSLLRYGGTPDLAFRASYELSKLLREKKNKEGEKKMLIKKKTLGKREEVPLHFSREMPLHFSLIGKILPI